MQGIRLATLAVLCAATCCARTSIPATASGYSYVDVSGIDVTGYVFPIRDARNDGTARVLRAEDAACVAEATCERDIWISGSSQPDSSLYTPSPSNVLQSNLVCAAESFYANKGRSIKGRMSIGANDIVRRFIDPAWTCEAQSAVGIDTGFQDWSIGDTLPAGWGVYCVSALSESIAPSGAVVEVSFDGRLTKADMTRLYKNVKATKRMFGGVVNTWYSDSSWDANISAYLVADVSVYNGYDYQTHADNGWYNHPISRTYPGLWQFGTSCWVQASGSGSSGGQYSHYSWNEITGAYVVLRPDLKGKVESATIYLAVNGQRTTAYHLSGGDYVTEGKILLGYIKAPLTKAGTRTLGGASCEQWSIPQALDSSKTILADLINNVWGTSSSGFPMISSAGVWSGVLDLVMKPDIEIDDETWNP